VQGRPAAPRKLCRGAARSGGAPAWETGAVVLGRLESCEGLLGGTGPRPKALEKGVVLGNGQDGRTTACSGVREPAVLWPLKAGAAVAAVWAGCLGVRADLGRRAW
jgi:hypothetical protein